MQAKLPEQFVFGQHTSPMRLIVLWHYPKSGENAPHIVDALNFFTPVCNVISVLVDMVSFAIDEVDNFWKNKFIAL